MKALEKRPGNRYRTAEEFGRALMVVRPSLPVPADDATQVLAAPGRARPPTRIIAPATAANQGRDRADARCPRPPRRAAAPPIVVADRRARAAGRASRGYLFTDVGRAAKLEVAGPVTGQAEATAGGS